MTTRAAADAGEPVQITAEEIQASEDTSKWFPSHVNIPDEARELLEQYSGFAPDEVVPHIKDLVSAAAFARFPLNLSLKFHIAQAQPRLHGLAVSVHWAVEIPRPYDDQTSQLPRGCLATQVWSNVP